MKLIYNFGILKNKIIGIEINGKIYFNQLINTKQTKNSIFFKFEQCTLEVNSSHFLHMKVIKQNDIICFVESNNQKLLNGVFLYYMYNTKGIPFEIMEDLFKDKFDLDREGFNLLKEIQEEITKNTFLNKNKTFKS